MHTTIQPPNGRGCGDRTEGMPYACCGTSADGMPIEHFVIDPAIPWPGQFQRGTKILPRNPNNPQSVNDLVIFVGEKYYQSAWDFVEETRRFGASRKMSPSLPFEKLTPGKSRMVFVHSKAIPKFTFTLQREAPLHGCKLKDAPGWEGLEAGEHPCVEKRHTCVFALNDLSELLHPEANPDSWHEYGFRIVMPSFSYVGIYPGGPHTPPSSNEWQIGIFLALPLTHIEFKNKAHKEAKERAEKAGFETAVLEW